MSSSTAIERQISFQIRMKERIRDTIGDLMTDEDLTAIVERGIEEVFFCERHEKRGYQTETLPPLIHEIVKEVLRDRMKDAVAAWLETHGPEVMDAVAQVVGEGAAGAMVRAVNLFMEDAMDRMESGIFEKLTKDQH